MAAPAVCALAESEPSVFWLDDAARPDPAPTLVGDIEADLVVVGGGYTGLWTALQAKEADPAREVVLLESQTCGWAASGRNGGFCAASLTHGEANGLARFPDEFDRLQRLGAQNLEGIVEAVQRHAIDAELERTGELDVATADWQLRDLQELADELGERAGRARLLGRDETRAIVDSPTYVGGWYDPDGVVMVHPAKLAWGLRRACVDLGVRIHEYTEVTAVQRHSAGVIVRTPYGQCIARRVALATNVFTGLLPRLRRLVVPVYDYALVTEPLSEQQRRAIGWNGRQGLADSANQFHYYRLTADQRILWGGYDTVYHFGGKVRREYDQRPETYARLAEHFFATFPQLEGLRFTHRWGGAIDTCSRFSPFWGTAHGGRLAYVAGYTGLGVGSSRFGARVMLDLLDGLDTERTRLSMVRTQPLPFPPEPARYLGIRLTQKAIAHADRHSGHRNLWLRALDKAGLGFDS